jgi:hypothetical protein
MTNLATLELASHSLDTRVPAIEISHDRRVEAQAARMIEIHPHFRGRSQWVQCHCRNRQLILKGKLPSFYLKQLAQEALRCLKGIDRIENRIQVASPVGEIRPGSESIAMPSSRRSANTTVLRPR